MLLTSKPVCYRYWSRPIGMLDEHDLPAQGKELKGRREIYVISFRIGGPTAPLGSFGAWRNGPCWFWVCCFMIFPGFGQSRPSLIDQRGRMGALGWFLDIAVTDSRRGLLRFPTIADQGKLTRRSSSGQFVDRTGASSVEQRQALRSSQSVNPDVMTRC